MDEKMVDYAAKSRKYKTFAKLVSAMFRELELNWRNKRYLLP
jgi:hypothetical protein